MSDILQRLLSPDVPNVQKDFQEKQFRLPRLGTEEQPVIFTLRALPYGRVQELKCVEEESNREIARRLGLKESTVATRILRGRAMLAEALEKEGYVHG